MPEPYICHDCWDLQIKEQAHQRLLKDLELAVISQRNKWIQDCNLKGIYCKKTFDNFEIKTQKAAYDTVKNYNKKDSILLVSPDYYGVGKTHLVAALVNHLINTEPSAEIIRNEYVAKKSCPVYFTTESQMSARIRATFNHDDGESERAVYKHLNTVSLLIIDDVGKVRPHDYSFLQGVYFQIIDERYVTEKPIILTSNLNFSDLEKHIGGACADRLKEMCNGNFVKMVGESYRGTNQKMPDKN